MIKIGSPHFTFVTHLSFLKVKFSIPFIMEFFWTFILPLFLKSNSLSANPTEWSNTQQFVGRFPTNCLSVFDHFVGLGLKGTTVPNRMILIYLETCNETVCFMLKIIFCGNLVYLLACHFFRYGGQHLISDGWLDILILFMHHC